MSLLYLLSSLPMLTFGAPPDITPAAFVATCREQLSEPNASTVEDLVGGHTRSHPFAEAWQDKENILRNAVARHRARTAGSDVTRWLRPVRGCDQRIEVGVEEAFQETDPLKKEKALDKIRWTSADELQGYDPLSIHVVFAYAVKLTILSRWQARLAESGQQTFDALTHVPITLNPEP